MAVGAPLGFFIQMPPAGTVSPQRVMMTTTMGSARFVRVRKLPETCEICPAHVGRGYLAEALVLGMGERR